MFNVAYHIATTNKDREVNFHKIRSYQKVTQADQVLEFVSIIELLLRSGSIYFQVSNAWKSALRGYLSLFRIIFGKFWLVPFFFFLKIKVSKTLHKSPRTKNPKLNVLVGPRKCLILSSGVSDFFRWVLDHIIFLKKKKKLKTCQKRS